MAIIRDLLSRVPTDLADCQNLMIDEEKLKIWAAIFGNRNELLARISLNLYLHKSQYTGDIALAVEDFNNGLFFEAGKEISEAFLALIGTTAS